MAYDVHKCTMIPRKLCPEILSRPGAVEKTSMSSLAEAVHLQAEEIKLEYSRNIVTNSRVTPSWREIVSITVLSYSSEIVNMSASSVTQDSTRADASFSNHRKRTRQETHSTVSAGEEATFLEHDNPKRTRENVQAISVASEDALSKRIRDRTAIVGNRRPHRFTYGNEAGCSSSHIRGPTLKCKRSEVYAMRKSIYA
nr:hypothetical protein [Tanacetum cinerariifolium]